MNTLSPAPAQWVKRQPLGSKSTLTSIPLEDPPGHDKDNAQHGEILETIEHSTYFASILRHVGALTVMAAMSAFLLQGWAGGNDIHRFYLMLSQSLLLAGGGFALSYGLKENKGARMFFGLNLLSATANMVTLGALIFSVAHIGALSHYPSFATWKASSTAELLGAGAAGMVVLAPLALFAFLVLARRSAVPLATVFLATNALLLIPVRESWMTGAVAMLGVLIPAWQVRRLYLADMSLRTKEGFFAAATLFVPALIIVLRSLLLYPVDTMLQCALAATGYGLLRSIMDLTEKSSRGRYGCGLSALAFAAFASCSLAHLLNLSEAVSWPVFGIMFAGFGADVALRGGDHKRSFACFTACVVIASQIIGFLDTGNALSALCLTIAGIGAVLTGRMCKNQTIIVVGFLMSIIGMAHQFYRIIVLVDFSNWATLAVIGTLSIVAASVIERHGAIIKLTWRRVLMREGE